MLDRAANRMTALKLLDVQLEVQEIRSDHLRAMLVRSGEDVRGDPGGRYLDWRSAEATAHGSRS